jgi:O-antigen ligase
MQSNDAVDAASQEKFRLSTLFRHAGRGDTPLSLYVLLTLVAAIGLGTLASVAPTLSLLAIGAAFGTTGLWLFLSRFEPWLELPRGGSFLLLGFALAFISLIRVDARDATSSSLGAQAAFEFALQALAGGCVVLAAITGRVSARLTPAFVLWTAFGAYAVLSALWAPQPQLAAIKGLQLIALVAITAITAMQFRTRRQAARFLTWLTTLALSGAIVLQALIGGVGSLLQSYEMGRERLTVLSIHPLILGGVAGAVALLLLTQRPRGIDWGALAVLVAITVLTSARIPIVVLTTLAIAWGIIRISAQQRARFLLGIVVPAVGALLLGMLILFVNSGGSFAALTAGLHSRDIRTLNGRIPLWQATLDRVDVGSESGLHLLTGLGYASFRHVGLESFAYAGDAHNALLQVYVELGIIGVVLWSLAAAACIKGAWLAGRFLPNRLLEVLPVVYILGIQTMEASLADSRSFLLFVLIFYCHSGRRSAAGSDEPALQHLGPTKGAEPFAFHGATAHASPLTHQA